MDSLYTKMRNVNGAIYFDAGFRDFIEMHMADLRKASIGNAFYMDLSDTQRARGHRNFNLICNMANIPYYLHWITMRVNRLMRAADYNQTEKELYTVDMDKLNTLILQYRESQTIN